MRNDYASIAQDQNIEYQNIKVKDYNGEGLLVKVNVTHQSRT